MRPLDTGFADELYTAANPLTRSTWLDETVNASSEVVRLTLNWRGITTGQPVDPRNPADPAYNFSAFDAPVSDATARGLTVLLTFYSAPNYAEGADRPGNVIPGTWKPKPGAVEDFAFALASRYPQVDYIQVFNEPNLSNYLEPQYVGTEAKSPEVYRDALNAAYEGVNDAGDAQVVTAGTAPYGEPPGGNRTRPIAFWRKVFCLTEQLEPTNCPTEPKFDVFAHHPINTSGGPLRSAIHPDDAATPDLKNLVRVLRKAERVNHVNGGKHPVWATELWWESDPPDTFEGIPLRRHAKWLQQALYILWKQGAEVVINLQIRDAAYDPQNPFPASVTGVFFRDGDRKPAFRAWRFPFVTHRKSRGKEIGAWGKAPASGNLVIERRHSGDWRRLDSFHVTAGEVFTRSLSISRSARLRARVGGVASLTWNQRG